MEEFRKLEAFCKEHGIGYELEVIFDEPKMEEKNRAEYNRRRSEIALQVFTSLFPISGNKEYSRDAEIAFDAAEAFLAEEAKRNNGENQC